MLTDYRYYILKFPQAELVNHHFHCDLTHNPAHLNKMAPSINLLPAEILTRIFSESTCFCSPRIHHESAPSIIGPILLSSICRHWRQVALDHRSLWSHIDLVVNTMDEDGRYHPPDVWIERSKGAPLYVHVYLPRPDTDDHEAQEEEESFMVHRLADFLSPLTPRICSLTVSIPWPYESTLKMLTDLWVAHGTPGHAKVLKVRAHPELAELNVHSSTLYKWFFESLEILHLRNAVLPWPKFAFGNLIELRIEVREGEWSMTSSELAAILASCPRLQHLTLDHLLIETTSSSNPKPVLLSELQTLELGGFDHIGVNSAVMLESVLSMINPSQNALSVSISLRYFSGPRTALDALGSFINRSNVTTLRVYGPEASMMSSQDPYFASQLGPLPRVQTLVLDKWCFCDSLEVEQMYRPAKTYENPRPINPELVLWPQLQNLYLHRCRLERGHLRQLISLHSLQSLFMRNCYDGSKPRSPFDIGTPTSEEYVQLLSAVVPRVVHFPSGWDSWPSFVH